MFSREAKDLVLRSIPTPVLSGVRRAYHSAKRFRAYGASARCRRALEAAAPEPRWLNPDILPSLHERFDFPPPTPTSMEELIAQGRGRVRQLSAVLGNGPPSLDRFLEIGCGAGLTALALAASGKQVTATDFDEGLFSKVALDGGVEFLGMDAQALELEDESFDCVYSYGAYEHIPDPGMAFAESLRVLRPGGKIYMHIGPLYLSAQGLHGYRIITTPFVQHLFEPDVISEFAQRIAPGHPDLRFLDEGYVNRWPLARYREVWERHRGEYDSVMYLEIPDDQHMGLVEEFASCFRSKSDSFDDFMIGWVEAVFVKR
ncbi:MAG: class I SAM-dependent methyltransferase [Candidatus Hydrogenedentes bacterium]|nr:class I SAM-dependent methyltransferase [Candidatus Hydrogenedentota bacterium]